jgi:Sigma-70, region 4
MHRIPEQLQVTIIAYDKLPKLQRAVVMLSCLEGVTYAEIARIVDRSTARIGIELDQAFVTMNADPYAVRAALDLASWQVPDPGAVSRAHRRHATSRARRRTRIGLVGVATATTLAAIVTVGAVHRPYVEPRQAGVWTFSHTVRPTPGWSIQSRTVERDWETTTLRAEEPGDGRCSVAVGAAGATWVRQLPRKPSQIRIGTRSANYAEHVWPNGGGAMLWWEYADTAWVIIECGRVSNPRNTLSSLANHVTLTAESVRLPYRVRSLPRHYEVTSVTRGLMSDSTVAFLTRSDYPEGVLQISIRYPAGLPMYGVNNSASVLRYSDDRHAAVCRPFGDSHICVRGAINTPGPIDISTQRGALAVLDQIAANLEIAADSEDSTSWFDAREALPS